MEKESEEKICQAFFVTWSAYRTGVFYVSMEPALFQLPSQHMQRRETEGIEWIHHFLILAVKYLVMHAYKLHDFPLLPILLSMEHYYFSKWHLMSNGSSQIMVRYNEQMWTEGGKGDIQRIVWINEFMRINNSHDQNWFAWFLLGFRCKNAWFYSILLSRALWLWLFQVTLKTAIIKVSLFNYRLVFAKG